MGSSYKRKWFPLVRTIFLPGTVMLMVLLSFPPVISAQQQNTDFQEAEIQKAELSGEAVAKRDLQKLKMRFEKLSQERNRYRRMVSILQRRVDELSREVRRLKAMDSNEEKQLLELAKTNKRYENQIGKLRQENTKLKRKLEKQTQKLEELNGGEKDKAENEEWGDVSLKDGDTEKKRLKLRLMEHIEMVKKLREQLSGTSEED